QLPEYMQFAYQALLDAVNLIDVENSGIEARTYRAHHAKEAMKKLVRAYFNESKWYHENYVPTFEEYMKTGLTTGGYPMLETTCFALEDNNLVTEEVIEWVSS
uniref:terpene synthase family protein n=1 Tax=Salmonella sp. s58078 TaxID=3159699 RepID=UPI00397F6515